MSGICAGVCIFNCVNIHLPLCSRMALLVFMAGIYSTGCYVLDWLLNILIPDRSMRLFIYLMYFQKVLGYSIY